MSKPIERVEIITGIQRRRRYTAEEKVRLVEQTMQPGMTVSAVARLYGVAPWTCPYQTGHLAWLDNLLAMNSRGERMRKPECGCL
jgi:transposase-like protein